MCSLILLGVVAVFSFGANAKVTFFLCKGEESLILSIG